MFTFFIIKAKQKKHGDYSKKQKMPLSILKKGVELAKKKKTHFEKIGMLLFTKIDKKGEKL